MTNSTTRSRRGAAHNEPPAAAGRPAGDTAVADPAAAPDRFAEITRALGTMNITDTNVVQAGPLPPAAFGAQAVAAAGWTYNQAITHLFSYDTPAGVWVFVNGLGWKRLSPASEFGVTSMIIIATMATHDNLPVNYHEDAAGLIDQIYV